MKGIRTEVIAANDPEEAVERLSPIFGSVAVVPNAAGEFDFRLVANFAEGMAAHRLTTTSGGTVTFHEPFDGYLLAIVDSGGLAVDLKHAQFECLSRGCLMLDPTEVRRWRWQPGSCEMLLIGTTEFNQRLVSLLDCPIPTRARFEAGVPGDSHGVSIARGIADLVRRCAASETADIPGARQTIRCLRDALTTALLFQIPNNYSRLLSGRPPGLSPRHVSRAVDFIHAHAGEAISVEDIAKAASTSIRSLQTGFADSKGMSPMAYLKGVRLAKVREDLLATQHDVSIAAVARRWGFSHMGLFAKAYGEAFGELPSMTRKRFMLGVEGNVSVRMIDRTSQTES
ncbi:AraC family transcriptional regulator [Paraburkholderia fungorum]|uniref:HTH araC/xylS-type domain-containing protein n=1 Tax=Paraburkholderia fungorum TaxID=134537 RepID=A0A420GX50_9BURK|nr:AraC family transcriptional regulator [Paraburkholderia fungorum]RKF49809.1 hypothetical protein BCY88_16660 [Paraburkholderia fungorum]